MEYTVKQVAERVELASRTVRYYDRIGLVSPERRSEAGYRLYGPEAEGRLRFVRRGKAIGFSLEEIRQLIAAADRGCCGEVVPELERLLADKVARVDAQIADLHAFRERLASYQAGRGSGCGCRGHGAFCGCLDDAPVSTKQPEGVTSMACQCGCNTTETPDTAGAEQTAVQTEGCGCNDACACGGALSGEERDAGRSGETQTAA